MERPPVAHAERLVSQMLISATRKSSGKTAFTAGLAATLNARGRRVQTFKKGPDYIDPMWLCRASGRSCINLDFYTTPQAEIEQTYRRYGAAADVILVEGNKGLHDGMDVNGGDCNAALAKLLDLPVILLIDASGITRGIAPLVHGYRTFDEEVRIAGIVLNKVAGARHESKLRTAVETYSDIPVLGAIHRTGDMEIEERHIGLTPSSEDTEASGRIQRIARVVADSVDVDRVIDLVRRRTAISTAAHSVPAGNGNNALTIGIARDRAFGFYYPDDLDTMARLGVRVVCFDAMRDRGLPEVDALFLGGGFPEFHLDELSQNAGLKRDIHRFVQDGRPVYAECGGLMYLCRDITFNGMTRSMVGAIEANAVMTERPVGRGYVQLEPTPAHPWRRSANGLQNDPVPAHEFHYSRLENLGSGVHFAYKVLRGVGIREGLDGLIHGNTLATYTHHRNVGPNRWVERFVAHALRCRAGRDEPRRAAL